LLNKSLHATICQVIGVRNDYNAWVLDQWSRKFYTCTTVRAALLNEAAEMGCELDENDEFVFVNYETGERFYEGDDGFCTVGDSC
jgi:hypothetical protein